MEGPWKDDDDEPEVKTREVKKLESSGLYPWQAAVVQSCKDQLVEGKEDDRHINVIVDVAGGIGKGSLGSFIRYHKLASYLPPALTSRDLIAFAMKFKSHAYVFDMPRSMPKGKALADFYNGIEQIKDGRLYEARYSPQMMTIERPAIWVFSNEMPDVSMLTKSRWLVWAVGEDGELEPIELTNKRRHQEEEEEDDEAIQDGDIYL